MVTSLPTTQKERIVIVDILRGFALFGVLQGNFSSMITNNVPESIINAHANSFDQFLLLIHDLLIQNKFLTLFAILFGYGFGVIMERLEKKNINSTPFFIRRMLWLFIFGLINLALWNGDILHVYAITGIFLLLFRKMSSRSVLWCSMIFLFIIPIAIRFYQKFLLHYSFDEDVVNNYYMAYKYGSLKDVATVNYQSYLPQWVYSWVEWRDMSEILGKFLLGYYILRKQMLIKLSENRLLINKVWKWTLFIMIAYLSLMILKDKKVLDVERYILFPFFRIGILATALFYAASIIRLYSKSRMKWLFSTFQNLGQMTLTNYLTHTIIYITLLYNIGFGLLGDFSFGIVWLLTFIIYFLQGQLSKWWLLRFWYGPIEWVWRQLTYKKRFPLLKNKSVP